MAPTLGPVLAGIFMVELETWIIPTLWNMAWNCKRFVDDTIGYVKNGSIDIILSKLNSFYPNIQFTYEIEEEIKVYRKSTNNNIYLNWNSFAPNTWKRSTSRTLIKRAYLIYSSKKHLVDELKHLE